MTAIKAFIKRYPLLSYLALVFAISWGGTLIAAGPDGFQSAREFGFSYVAMLAGPSVAGILLTGLVDGRAGLSELISRLLRWRVGVRWYAVALLTAPLLFMGVLLGLSLASPDFFPRIFTEEDKVFLVWYSVVAGLMVSVFEELGWTGFAVPKMRQLYGVLGTGLIVGIMFAAWDFLVVFWMSEANSAAGALPMVIFMPATLLTWLPAFRVLMVWVYERTNGSLLLAMLMSASLWTSWTMLTPLVTTLVGIPLVIYYLVFTAALWVVIGAIALANHEHLARRPPLQRRPA